MKETILFFGYSEWSNWRGHHDLVVEFSKNNRVAFVEVMPRYNCFSIRGSKSFVKKLFDNHAKRINDNLIIFPSISMLPYALPIFSKIWRKKIAELSIKLSKKLQSLYINKQLKILGWRPSILMFCEAFDLFHVGRFGESISCYRTYDEITNFFSNQYIADVIGDIEVKNIHKVDLVFAASEAQYKKRKPLNPNVFLVPNAANFWHYNKALRDELERPSDIKNVSSPVIGLISTIDFRIDFSLLGAIAKSHPEWSLILIGPVREYSNEEWRENVRSLRSLRNVHLLGQRDFRLLPAYMKYFDIGIIPFLVTPVTNTMYPYKLHEYLAAGLPVVSTELDELEPFRGIICLARSKEEFIEMIEEELRTNSAPKRKKRIEVASQNSWTVRAEQMLFLVNKIRVQKDDSQTNRKD